VGNPGILISTGRLVDVPYCFYRSFPWTRKPLKITFFAIFTPWGVDKWGELFYTERVAPIKYFGVYPPTWLNISYLVKKRNYWRCERCHHKLDKTTNLAVLQLDGNRGNIEPWNLAALCPNCRKYIQPFGLETLLLAYDSPGIFGNNEPWLKSHIAGIKEAVYFGLSPADGEAITSYPHSTTSLNVGGGSPQSPTRY